MKQFEFEIKHDNGTITLRTFARNLEEAQNVICKAEDCPRSALGYWRIVPTKKQLAKTKRLMQNID